MHKFRTQLLATTAMLALTGAAYAADMPVKAPPMAPAPPVINWTGFYVGGQVGGASFDPSCHSFNTAFETGRDPCLVEGEGIHDLQHSGSLSSSSFIGGGRVGYDWQFWTHAVVGIVGEFDWADFKGSVQTVVPFTQGNLPAGTALTASEKIDWLASVRGRLGWAFDSVLFYGTAGVAWTEIKTSASFVEPLDPADSFTSQGSTDRTGVVAGGGFEYRWTPNLSVVGELLWYGFGTTSRSAVCACGGTPTTYTTQFNNQDILAGTLGVNWRF
jgi:outer membrane immunogenic protein